MQRTLLQRPRQASTRKWLLPSICLHKRPELIRRLRARSKDIRRKLEREMSKKKIEKLENKEAMHSGEDTEGRRRSHNPSRPMGI